MLVDTHCHLTFPQFDDDRNSLIESIFESDIDWVLNPASSLEDIPQMIDLASKWRDKIFLALGIHPHYALEVDEYTFENAYNLLNEFEYKAIGEVGFDFYRQEKKVVFERQKRLFEFFIDLAREKNLPLIIHCRQAETELLSVLDEKSILGNFVVHCFSSTVDFAKKVLDRAGFISFTANITYKRADDLRQVVKFVPLDRIMLETDSPFLPPEGRRGKRNDPRTVGVICEMISKIKGLSFYKVAEKTSSNACKFFGIEVG